MSQPVIRVIIGSTRPVRIGDQIAEGVAARIRAATDAVVEIVDLRTLDLPFLDEPRMPALGDYAHDHTHGWADLVATSDAIVLVSPQYNGGYPAAVKNAIDFLFAEWRGTPLLLVTYGGRGGGMAAGQLRQVLEFIGADVLPEGVEISLGRDDYGDGSRLVDPDRSLAPAQEALEAAGHELARRIADATGVASSDLVDATSARRSTS